MYNVANCRGGILQISVLNVFMTWADTPLSAVVLVTVMYNVTNCCGAVTQISLIILIEYAFMAWTGTSLHIISVRNALCCELLGWDLIN